MFQAQLGRSSNSKRARTSSGRSPRPGRCSRILIISSRLTQYPSLLLTSLILRHTIQSPHTLSGFASAADSLHGSANESTVNSIFGSFHPREHCSCFPVCSRLTFLFLFGFQVRNGVPGSGSRRCKIHSSLSHSSSQLSSFAGSLSFVIGRHHGQRPNVRGESRQVVTQILGRNMVSVTEAADSLCTV